MSYLESNNPAQHGFRPGYSCTSQPINIVEHLAKDVDSQKQIDMIFLDYSKAFNTVPHACTQRLLTKLQITELIIKYITGYLIG